MGDVKLLSQARPVSEFGSQELKSLLVDMHDTMAHLNGAGLAAPQIGVSLQVVIFGVAGNSRYPDAPDVPMTTLINPVIEPIGHELEDGWEGCLSVPGLRAVVPRYRKIRYRGHDQLGAPVNVLAEGFHARVVQHECDHLAGILYPVRIRDFSQFGFIDALFPGEAPEGSDLPSDTRQRRP